MTSPNCVESLTRPPAAQSILFTPFASSHLPLPIKSLLQAMKHYDQTYSY
ncbi:hypothetical protein BVI434_1660036 [Burkholderia vietnamiensis]|nr:hypothetical protein BVI434_1660036 [Burkholderia vietnamiensis]